MVDIVASVRCWYKVGMRRRPHFHQLPTWAQRIFAICVVTPNTKYDVCWYCSRIPSILAPGWERGGGGGTLIFSNIRRPGPFLGLTFWYFVMTPKENHKIFIPQKIFIFLKTLKGIEIQNFEPQNGASLRMNENIIVPPTSTLSSQIETGAGGVQTQITEKKTLIKVFIVGFFCNYIIFFYGSKGSKHLSGGGGCNFLLLLFFFLGGGWGGTNPYFYRNLYNLWFFGGGGGGSGPPIPLWIRAWVRNK